MRDIYIIRWKIVGLGRDRVPGGGGGWHFTGKTPSFKKLPTCLMARPAIPAHAHRMRMQMMKN